jgi:hypothetical protein
VHLYPVNGDINVDSLKEEIVTITILNNKNSMLKQTLFNLDIKILTLIIEEDQTIPFNQVKTKP